MEIASPTGILSDANRIFYASTFLSGTAAVWWYTMVQAGQTPESWDQFKAAMIKEFPEDHVRRAQDRLRKLKQISSVFRYLSEFRNIVLTISDVTDGKKWEKFCTGLKYEVRLEVMKAITTSFDEAAQIALRVDSALWSAGQHSLFGFQGYAGRPSSSNNVQMPMEIGNMEKKGDGVPRQGMSSQRLKDLRNTACFICHKAGCRPWKQKNEAAISNIEVDGGNGEDSEGDHLVSASNDTSEN